jgi:hypothetical protein
MHGLSGGSWYLALDSLSRWARFDFTIDVLFILREYSINTASEHDVVSLVFAFDDSANRHIVVCTRE